LETLSLTLQQPLEFLIYTSIIFMIIIGVFLIKLLIDLSGLVNTAQSFLQVTQKELEPAISELKQTLTSINNVSSNITNQFSGMNSGLQKGAKAFVETAALLVGKTAGIGEMFGKNLKETIYLLFKPKK